MPKPGVLISGPTISIDEPFIQELQNHAGILKCRLNNKIAAIFETAEIGVLVLEITADSWSDLNIIKTIKRKFPNIEIILINGNDDQGVLAKAFALGAKDAFPKSYDRELLVERIQALLRQIWITS